MFAHKKNKIEVPEEETAVARVNQDMVVRNMPNLAKIRTTIISAAEKSSFPENHPLSQINPPKQNFKVVGLIIIVGGLIFIGGLVYLSYVYIIKPQTKETAVVTEKPTVIPSISEIASPTPPIVEISIIPAIVATTTPEIIDGLSSSTETIMPEESGGKPGDNLPALLDTDFDGLNDEEEAILGTNLELVDTNGNTYADLVEVQNNYNPLAQGKLSANVNLKMYSESGVGYGILYPKNWAPNVLNNGATIAFNAPDDSIIQISREDNTERQSIMGWYNNLFPDATITYEKLKSTDEWDGVWSDDGLNFYLTDKKKTNIYILSYVPSVAGRIAYPNIYKLMVSSFALK